MTTTRSPAVGIESIDATTRRAQTRLQPLARSPRRPPRQRPRSSRRSASTTSSSSTRSPSRARAGTSRSTTAPTRPGASRRASRPSTSASPVDLADDFPAIGEVNDEIRQLAPRGLRPAPLRPARASGPPTTPSTASPSAAASRVFRQADREDRLVHLMRVNLLKRMESSVASFRLTLERQLAGIDAVLARLDAADRSRTPRSMSSTSRRRTSTTPRSSRFSSARASASSPPTSTASAGARTSTRTATGIELLLEVAARRDARPRRQARPPPRAAHATRPRPRSTPATARPSSSRPSPTPRPTSTSTSRRSPSPSSACTPRSSPAPAATRRRCPACGRPWASILSAFAPRAKERPADIADEGEIDLLIATDCISEGQNLQDCDYARQRRHPLEPRPHHPALRSHRPHRLTQRADPARQLLARRGARRVHRPRRPRLGPHGAPRRLGHRRGERDRDASRATR